AAATDRRAFTAANGGAAAHAVALVDAHAHARTAHAVALADDHGAAAAAGAAAPGMPVPIRPAVDAFGHAHLVGGVAERNAIGRRGKRWLRADAPGSGRDQSGRENRPHVFPPGLSFRRAGSRGQVPDSTARRRFRSGAGRVRDDARVML